MQISRRARIFLKTLATMSNERPRNIWFSMDEVAERMGLSWGETARAALQRYDAQPRLIDIQPPTILSPCRKKGGSSLLGRPGVDLTVAVQNIE